jgi:hypothetical protein
MRANDPEFAAKHRDIVGLYAHPPALGLSVDEKSQIQALDRTQPGSADEEGPRRNVTHGHKRHGTTTLFAALHVLDPKALRLNRKSQPVLAVVNRGKEKLEAIH